MKDSGIEWIGDIPSGWNVTKHKWVMQKEKQLCKEYSGEDIISLTMKGIIKRDLVNPSGKMPASFDGYQRVRKGNLLLCLFDIDVTPRCVGLINDDGLTSPAYSQYKMLAKNFAPYYDYLLRTIDDRKDFLHLSKNLRSSLKEDDFGNICTIKPPIEKQKAIAGFLDYILPEIESIVERTKSTIEDYKLLKQSIITEAVTKGLDKNVEMKDSGIEWIGEIPVGWIVAPHKYVMYKIKKIKYVYESEDILSLTLNGVIKRDLINPSGKMPATFDGYQKVYKDNLLLCLFDIDVTPRCVGWIPFDGLTSPAYSQFVLRENGYSPYYNYLLRAIDDTKSLLHLSKNLRSSLTETDFGNINTIIPPMEEQIAIADYLDKTLPEIDDLILRKQQLLSQLEQYKKSLIYEYVTGKKEVE